MATDEILQRARKARADKVAAQRYSLSWRGGGSESCVTFDRVLQVLGLQPQSVRSLLSRGHGQWEWMRANPLTGEPDLLTVTRLVPVKSKPKRGRPAKHVDWERLGAEENGTLLAESARTVPNRRKSRTDDKR